VSHAVQPASRAMGRLAQRHHTSAPSPQQGHPRVAVRPEPHRLGLAVGKRGGLAWCWGGGDPAGAVTPVQNRRAALAGVVPVGEGQLGFTGNLDGLGRARQRGRLGVGGGSGGQPRQG
jgi:hypothetical protein